jgi:hypothetical protein
VVHFILFNIQGIVFVSSSDVPNESIVKSLAILPTTLRRLDIIGYIFNFSTCPIFPHLTCFNWRMEANTTLDGIEDKFPMLTTLLIEAQRSTLTSIEPLRKLSHLRILSIQSHTLVDITPLSPLLLLESCCFGDCPKIVNFTPVKHVANVQRYDPDSDSVNSDFEDDSSDSDTDVSENDSSESDNDD